MEWLNLHISTLDSAEVVGADPIERATWLFLLRYCIGQENGGLIEECAGWGDRRWQQVVRVTLREIRRDSQLWRFEGQHLRVNLYPMEKQKEVEAKREAGKLTASKRWSKQSCSADSSAISSADAEGERKGNRKGKEEEGKEGAQARAVGNELPEFPQILKTDAFLAAWSDWLAYRRERKLSAWKPRTIQAQLATLADLGEPSAVESIRQSIRNGWQGLFEPRNGISGHNPPRPPSFA